MSKLQDLIESVRATLSKIEDESHHLSDESIEDLAKALQEADDMLDNEISELL